MSPSESPGSAPLLTLRLPRHHNVRVTVYDAHHREILRPEDATAELTLPRGLYSVRVEGPTGLEEQAIRLDRDLDLSSMLPKRYSAAPIRSSQLAHEYYAGPSQRLSRTTTRPSLAPAANAALFVFARAIDKDRASAFQSGSGLSLHHADGERLTEFSDSEVEADANAGWWSFSAMAPSGFYRLAASGDDAREIGIHLFPDWQTQVFLLVGADGPVLQGCRIFASRKGDGFSADDEVAELVDDSVAALADPTAEPPESLVRDLLNQKFENPVVGLIGAHLLLRANQRDQRQAQDRRYELSRVVDRLESILGNCADVQALRLALWPQQVSKAPVMFQHPPMLLAGLEAVIDAARRNPSLIADAPIVDDIVDNLCADSVWTTWSRLLDVTGLESFKSFGPPSAAAAPSSTPSQTSPSQWVQAGILEAIEQQAERARRRDRSGRGTLPAGLSLDQLARQLQVSPQRIDRALREIVQMTDHELMDAFGRGEAQTAADIRTAFAKFVLR